MKIFVTGATGKVGSRFVPYLLKQGHEVRILVRNLEGASTLKEQGAEVVLGDLLDNENLIEAVRGVDAVVHIAAQFRGGISEEMAKAINIDATITLAKAALDAGVTRFVFTSTGNVYNNSLVNRPCREDDVLTATALYPKTKMAAEEALLRLYSEQGLDIRIMRLGFVYGDNDPHIQEILPFLSNWNPSKAMSVVHHQDVSQALLLGASTPGIGGRIYNVADDNPITVGEFYKLQGEPEQVPPNGGWPSFNQWDMILDTARIKSELNFNTKYPSLYIARDKGAL
ncbi:NAD-dependent epimerase/dehydratase family protein [Clostridium beijerinckii]|uniref:NAD-dependent epimerase/dehydratase family protein n=1 Tax=Clostridium beijerinckii TaxID=1520 RepID=UPI000809E717|nr:NAD(P)-dependent oxidoreductase [Clostridium beijerinckii]OCA98676.1 epimerase [Clostridium beijerinckii]